MSAQTTMYAISAVIAIDSDEIWTKSVQVPTFYLMADVQGIVSEEHAMRIALRMFADLGHAEDAVSVRVAATSMSAHS